MRTAEKRLFVGSNLRDVLAPTVNVGSRVEQILTPASANFAISRALSIGTAIAASATWPAATQIPIAVDFWLEEPFTVYQLGWYNGSGTMTDSTDVGIYNSSNVRQISTGSTVRSGVSLLQLVDVADTTLQPGRYRLVATNAGTTANQVLAWAGTATASVWGMLGVYESATTVTTLPDPIVGLTTASTVTALPVSVIAGRATL